MIMEGKLLKEAAAIIAEAKNLVAFSGAGFSSLFRIPTCRDPGGIWDRFSPDDFGAGGLSMLTGLSKLGRQFLKEMLTIFSQARPNPGHLALAELERMGILRSVITQNVDNLHIEAGNTRVIEVHGNFYRFRCLVCGAKFKLAKEDFLSLLEGIAEAPEGEDLSGLVPRCRCGGVARIDVVGFGEPVEDFPQAEAEAESCDVMLALGTSGVITPAAFIPRFAKRAGARVIEINPTGCYFPEIIELYIGEKTGEAMPEIMKEVRRIKGAG